MLTDFEPTIAQIDAMIALVVERANTHVTNAYPREHCRAAEFAGTLRDLAQARELLVVAQERTEPTRRAQRMAEKAAKL